MIETDPTAVMLVGGQYDLLPALRSSGQSRIEMLCRFSGKKSVVMLLNKNPFPIPCTHNHGLTLLLRI